jgi:protein-disulfide isomerase
MTLRPPVTADDHAVGRPDSSLTLVEYGDYQCPYCAAAEPVVRAVRRALGENLRFVFRNFPLTELHPAAEAAAELAEAAAQHGKFWDVHHAIYAWSRRNGPETFGVDMFEAIARTAGLDVKDALEAIETHRFIDRIRGDFNSGIRSGVNGTPTFFINGARYDGRHDEDSMIEALTRESRRASGAPAH